MSNQKQSFNKIDKKRKIPKPIQKVTNSNPFNVIKKI